MMRGHTFTRAHFLLYFIKAAERAESASLGKKENWVLCPHRKVVEQIYDKSMSAEGVEKVK